MIEYFVYTLTNYCLEIYVITFLCYFLHVDIDAIGRFTLRSLQDDDKDYQNNIYHDMTGHDPNNYLTRIPLSKYFFGANSPIFRNLNIGQLLGKLLASNVHDKLLPCCNRYHNM